MHDLVLAMAGGFEASTLIPFLRSLHAAGFAGEVRLLLHRNPPGTTEALRREGATPIAVELEGVPETWSYNVARYRLFADELAACDADRVLLADSRDVIFQRDPFSTALAEEGLHLFEEHPSRPIGACIWTSSWLRYRYGDAALLPVASRPVLCSGFVLGDTRRIRSYVALVAEEILPSLRATHYMAGYDQGIVNALAYSGRLEGLVAHPWASALALHLGNAPPGEVHADRLGRVVNRAGEVACAVHQYDRHRALLALRERYLQDARPGASVRSSSSGVAR